MGKAVWKDISVEVGGRRLSGHFMVEKGMITVTYNGQQKTTQVGGMPPEALARQLLRELAR